MTLIDRRGDDLAKYPGESKKYISNFQSWNDTCMLTTTCYPVAFFTCWLHNLGETLFSSTTKDSYKYLDISFLPLIEDLIVSHATPKYHMEQNLLGHAHQGRNSGTLVLYQMQSIHLHMQASCYKFKCLLILHMDFPNNFSMKKLHISKRF
jgi:hypothetical protein